MKLSFGFLMKFPLYFFLNRTPLHIAIEKANNDIVQQLLSCEKLDVNLKSI